MQWNQDRLEILRGIMGDADFFQLFTTKYVPISEDLIKIFLQMGNEELARGIIWAANENEGE